MIERTTRLPRVLVLGATGGVGGLVARELEARAQVEVVRTTRKAQQIEAWRTEGRSSVLLDLDNPMTFPEALSGIERLFIMTGYTMNMVTQVKTITDAAVDAGIGFIVHLGVLSNGKSTDPHYAWHELVERYISTSGMPYCNLHANFFMENLLSFMKISQNTLTWPIRDQSIGWITGEDVAAVAAKILAEGPEAHASKTYQLSTDVVDGPQLAATLSKALGREINPLVVTPDDLKAALDAGQVELPSGMDAPFSASMLELARQVSDGRLSYAATTTDVVKTLLGRDPIHFEQWARDHKDQLLKSGH